MHVTSLDWLIVVVSIAISFLPAVLLAKRAGSSTAGFFTSGRSAPWWLIGPSMVATSLSTHTPHSLTSLGRSGAARRPDLGEGRSFVLPAMAAVFSYARLWRRSRVLTALEFYEIRYAGPA